MTALKNHPNRWLRPAAAASFDKMEAAAGRVFNVTDAGRLESTQQGLINRYKKGGAANRPPYLYKPYEPASGSPHVKNGGEATDIGSESDRAWIKANGAFYGWFFTVPWDIVHCVYIEAKDASKLAPNSSTPNGFNQVTKDRQDWLNSRGWKLKADGLFGPASRKAYGEYQNELKKMGLYSGKIDGLWGAGTQAAHQKHFDDVMAQNNKPAPQSEGAGHNPFGIPWAAGLQKIANLYGANTAVDQEWGAKSAKGFAEFLRKNHGYSGNDELGPQMWAAIARWLRKNYGYEGNDVPGPTMRQKLRDAEAANYKTLK